MTHVFQRELQSFKDTFQKGSQIYKYIRRRWAEKPLYLDRTLSYVRKARHSPGMNVKERDTNIDKIAKRLLARRINGKPNCRISSSPKAQSNQEKSEHCYFNWICNNPAKTTQRTKSAGYLCPWCPKDYYNAEYLMYHLRSNHPRFEFVLHKPTQDNPHPLIDMSLNLQFDGSYCGFKYPGHDLKHDFKFKIPDHQKRMTSTTHVRVYFRKKNRVYSKRRHQNGGCANINAFKSEGDDGEADVDVCSGRLYYHTSTCLPVKPNEVDVDSEADIDPEWLRERTQLMIDEFTDVNEGEKEILKLWNLHIMKNYKYKGDAMMRQACLDFVDLEGHNVIARNLSKNFTVHLANLFDWGLISSRDMLECTKKLRKLRQPQISSPPKTPGKIKSEKNSEKSPHTPPAKRACLLNSNCNQ